MCSDPHVVDALAAATLPDHMSMEQRQAEMFHQAERANMWLFSMVARTD